MLNRGTTAEVAPSNGHPGKETAAPKKFGKIDVNAILFKAAFECRSKEETRYYLNGVYVQPHPERGALLIATDGHRLIGIHDETGQCEEAAIIHVDPRALTALKQPKKEPEIPRLTLDERGIVTCGTYRGVTCGVIDGTYPEYQRVLLPVLEQLKKGASSPAAFNHEYIGAWSKIAAIVMGERRAIKIISTSEADPALILFDGAPHVFGVLMPMRSSVQTGMPAFMKPILDATQRKIDEARAAREEAEAKAAAQPAVAVKRKKPTTAKAKAKAKTKIKKRRAKTRK